MWVWWGWGGGVGVVLLILTAIARQGRVVFGCFFGRVVSTGICVRLLVSFIFDGAGVSV